MLSPSELYPLALAWLQALQLTPYPAPRVRWGTW